MKTVITLSLVMLMISGCGTVMDIEKAKSQLMKVDREFSKMSAEQGMFEAFDFYMDDNATLYRDRHHPFVGREAIRPILGNNPNATLTWEPISADIAVSGDLGYTLGQWTYTVKDSTGYESQSHGYYISVWKKNINGDWKWVFDSGISAPAEEVVEEI